MVCAHNKINRTCKDDPAGHDTRREKERQKKRWEDNISEWTGLGLGEALRKAEVSEEWRKVVAGSSLMPQRSFRLQDELVRMLSYDADKQNKTFEASILNTRKI